MGTGMRYGKRAHSARFKCLSTAKVFHHCYPLGVRHRAPELFLRILGCYSNIQIALSQLQSYPSARQ